MQRVLSSKSLHRWRRKRGRDKKDKVEGGGKCVDAISTGGPRGGEEEMKRRKGKRGLRTEAKVRGGYSLCYGITVPRGGWESADRTERWRKVSKSFNVWTPNTYSVTEESTAML